MNTDLLRSFAAVCRLGSYTGAARELFLSQPTVYQHVRSLEKQLKVRLIKQSHKGAIPTPEGRALLPLATRLLAEEERLLWTMLKEDPAEPSARLELIAGTTFGETVIPHTLAAYRREHPRVSIHVEIHHDPTEIDQTLLRDQHDGGFHSNGVSRSGLIKDPVVEDHLILVVPPDHALSSASCVSPAALVREGIICYASPYGVRSAIDSWAGAQGVAIPTRFELDSQVAIMNMVANDGGVAVVSGLGAVQHLRSGALIGIRLEPELWRYWFFVHASQEQPHPAMGRLLEVMSSVVDGEYRVMRELLRQ